jgi:hypothetical protein
MPLIPRGRFKSSSQGKNWWRRLVAGLSWFAEAVATVLGDKDLVQPKDIASKVGLSGSIIGSKSRFRVRMKPSPLR